MRKDHVLRDFHAARWDEPIVYELGRPGARGQVFGVPENEVTASVGDVSSLVPKAIARPDRPGLPELTEFEVMRHYLHLSQQTLGMMNISLFGTCTMKYSSKLAEFLANRPELAETHPYQPEDTLQGTMEIMYDLDRQLRSLSGMDQFVFQAGGGADAAYTMTAMTRAYLQSKGELNTRNEVITSIQAHPCNAATAATAGFKIITLPLEEGGYPSLAALEAAVSGRTALLMVGNPDDTGIYNPDIKEWVRIVKEAGGLCFYDHANFNGVMGKVSARELGFDACMFMLHKTFGAPKGGGGPAVGAFGCSHALSAFLPVPVIVRDADGYKADLARPLACGKIREFWGNVPIIFRAHAWLLAMGADGVNLASDISVLANNYIDKKLAGIRGLDRSHANIRKWRMEMTRWSLGRMKMETGVGTLEASNRLADFGIDPWWTSHEPWFVDEPFTPEAGELWSKSDIDQWIAAVQQISDEAYSNPDIVINAPHRQPIAKVKRSWPNDPQKWAMTWRAYKRKHGTADSASRPAAGGEGGDSSVKNDPPMRGGK